MKKVLLLGDSIRMGYDDYVKEELNDFDVYYDSDDNGRFISYNIWMFNQFNNKYGPFDIVHFNSGYWDMTPEGPHREHETPIDEYVKSLERLVDYIKSTGATPIFATTVPIYDTPKKDGLYEAVDHQNKVVIEYNSKATELMKRKGVMINDLYSLMEKEERYGKCYDSLHLTDENYKKCAKQVAKCVRLAAK